MVRTLTKRLRDYVEKLIGEIKTEGVYLQGYCRMGCVDEFCVEHRTKKLTYIGCLRDLYNNFPELHNFFKEKGLVELMEDSQNKITAKKSAKIAG